MGIPDHLTCLLRNLYAGQEAAVRTGNGTTDWFQIGQGVRQGCILLPCLFNWRRQWHPTPVLLPGISHGRVCRVHHEKRWTGINTGWNQDGREKYQ